MRQNKIQFYLIAALSFLAYQAPSFAAATLFENLAGTYKVKSCALLDNFEPQPADYYCHLKTVTISRDQAKIYSFTYIDELGHPGLLQVFTEHEKRSQKFSDVAQFTEDNQTARWQRVQDDKETKLYINEIYDFTSGQNTLHLSRMFTLYQGDRFKHLIWDYELEPIK